ncbi:MAG: trimethylamine methyltransferase family protein [Candidatus Latescibacterota bacterium]
MLQLTVLEAAQLQRIHRASVEILETVGVHLPHAEVRERFAQAGARVEEAGQRVYIPEALVERSLHTAGKSFTLYGRDPARRARFGIGQRNYNSIAGEALWVDDTGTQRRYASLEDVVTATRLADGLEWINLVGAMADPQEIPVACRCVEVAAAQVRHTTKPIHFWFHDRVSARYVLEIMAAVAGGELEAGRRPLAYPFLEPISPLRFPYHGVDLLFETAAYSLPVPIGPMAQVGATAPGTLAGTLAQENAEILAGVCITQLIRPGLAVCYGGIPHAFDMRTTQLIFAGPEQALMAVAMTQLGKHYGLPVYINVGLTDSKVPDGQAGLEAGMTLLCGALAGADIFGHLGICGVDQGSSLAMLLLQHEIVAYVERLLRGFVVDDEHLGLETLRERAAGGTFLDTEHTVRHFRQEVWFPALLDRRFWAHWVEEGARDMHQRCVEAKDRVLSSHQPEPLAPEVEREVGRIVAAARRHLAKA